MDEPPPTGEPSASACVSFPATSSPQSPPFDVWEFRVGGMRCGNCARNIESKLRQTFTSKILAVDVDVRAGRVKVSTSGACCRRPSAAPGIVTHAQIAAVIESLGLDVSLLNEAAPTNNSSTSAMSADFSASPSSCATADETGTPVERRADAKCGGQEASSTAQLRYAELQVEGMACASCARHIEKQVQKLPAVTSITVNLILDSATVEYRASCDPSFPSPTVTIEEIRRQIEDLGYHASVTLDRLRDFPSTAPPWPPTRVPPSGAHGDAVAGGDRRDREAQRLGSLSAPATRAPQAATLHLCLLPPLPSRGMLSCPRRADLQTFSPSTRDASLASSSLLSTSTQPLLHSASTQTEAHGVSSLPHQASCARAVSPTQCPSSTSLSSDSSCSSDTSERVAAFVSWLEQQSGVASVTAAPDGDAAERARRRTQVFFSSLGSAACTGQPGAAALSRSTYHPAPLASTAPRAPYELSVERRQLQLCLPGIKVTYFPDQVGAREILERAREAGWNVEWDATAKQKFGDLQQAAKVESALFRQFISALLPSIIIFAMMMVIPMDAFPEWMNLRLIPGISLRLLLVLLLTTAVMYGPGWRFHRAAFEATRHRIADMNVLVSLATNIAFLYSLLAVLFTIYVSVTPTDPPTFFEVSAVLICVLLLGKLLEGKAKRRALVALDELSAAQPEFAVVVRRQASAAEHFDEIIPVELLHLGDVVRVPPGATVPADGEKINEESLLSEALLTGESMPVSKMKGDPVLGGSMVGASLLLVRVQKLGTASVLGQIFQLVKEAQGTKTKTQEFIDHVAGYFVPGVLLISAVTVVVWLILLFGGIVTPSLSHFDEKTREAFPVASRILFALQFGIGVLSIACPCALGLAAPTALMVGTGVAARLGILVKSGQAFELATKLKALVLDKTGTVTRASALGLSVRDLSSPALPEGGVASRTGKDSQLSRDFTEHASETTAGIARGHGLASTSPSTEKEKTPLHATEQTSSANTSTTSAQNTSVSSFQEMLSAFVWILGVAERHSEHPVAASLMDFVRSWKDLPPLASPSSFKALPGRGLSCRIGKDLAVEVTSLTNAESSRAPLRSFDSSTVCAPATSGTSDGASPSSTPASPAAPQIGCCSGSQRRDTREETTRKGEKGKHRGTTAAVGNRRGDIEGEQAGECTNSACACKPCRCRLGGFNCGCLGSPAVAKMTPDFSALKAWAESQQRLGATVSLVVVNQVCLGAVALRDAVKPESREVVSLLQSHFGLEVWMCTGDSIRTALATADEVGLSRSRVVAEALPSTKVAVLEKLRKADEGQTPRCVGMAGDGLNDAPALAHADLSMALGAGADLALTAADVVVLKSRISDLVAFLELSRAVLFTIRLSILWACIFNAAGIPLAAGAFYKFKVFVPPTLAGAMMALSSVLVISNALMLRRFRPSLIPRSSSSSSSRCHFPSATSSSLRRPVFSIHAWFSGSRGRRVYPAGAHPPRNSSLCVAAADSAAGDTDSATLGSGTRTRLGLAAEFASLRTQDFTHPLVSREHADA
ncbi:UNVERIFIED_CONTAM: heavy metal translocating P-type ATPase subfamily protein [Hammondia hammondi]|eukprot:XP_008887635.1 heavy metal translocating P-type ATPase subfamily protein [Hammondia hammondi]